MKRKLIIKKESPINLIMSIKKCEDFTNIIAFKRNASGNIYFADYDFTNGNLRLFTCSGITEKKFENYKSALTYLRYKA